MSTMAYAVGDINDWNEQLPQLPNPIPHVVPNSLSIVFIGLTEISISVKSVEKKTYIPINSIISFHEFYNGFFTCSKVLTTNPGQCEMYVKEMPEEIVQIIKDAQNE